MQYRVSKLNNDFGETHTVLQYVFDTHEEAIRFANERDQDDENSLGYGIHQQFKTVHENPYLIVANGHLYKMDNDLLFHFRGFTFSSIGEVAV